MKFLKNMTKAGNAIALILLIVLVSLLSNVPAGAQLAAEQPVSGSLPAGATPSITITTEAYLSVSPTTVGLGQTFLVNMWLHPPIHVERQLSKPS